MENFFRQVLSELKIHLKTHQVEIQDKIARSACDAAGDFFIVPISEESLILPELKQILEDFEEKHPLGRFIDVDLNDEQGQTYSSGKSKLCFYCKEKPAIECRRQNAHNIEDLRAFMFSKMEGYCSQQRENTLTKQLSALATKALLAEISLTPKPGLVDKFSNGSHTDMNYQTFLDSTAAISPWFGELVSAGFTFNDSNLTKALPVIRTIGLKMESAMFKATNHVNTQKGIIFLMGLSLFACGKLFKEYSTFDIKKFRTIVKGICKDLVNNELIKQSQSAKTHGEIIFSKYGFSGARGEAESGLNTVFEFGLPQLTGFSQLNDKIQMKCFLAIAARNNDTNILYRSGPDVLKSFQKLCLKALENFNETNYNAVINFCKNENCSPGGSADLLAVAIYIWSVIQNPELQINASLTQQK